MRTDTERMDWLEKYGFGAALINDDNGHWAVAFDGWQNILKGKEPYDIQTTHFVEKDKWRDDIRSAIDEAMDEHAKHKKGEQHE